MKKYIALVAFLALASVLWAEGDAVKAVFAQISGKVEFQKPGAAWKAAKVGDVVEKGTIVSTGFKSSATLKLESVSLYLKPLTRLTLEEALKTSGGTQTKLYLLAGRVKADVPPQAGKSTDFRIKSPTATASVRGTEFEFDGMNLLVSRGRVQYLTRTNQFRLVGAREFAYIALNGTVAPPTPVSSLSDLGDAAQIVEQGSLATFSPPSSPQAQRSTSVRITVQ